jgi:ankyrin repeat protein
MDIVQYLLLEKANVEAQSTSDFTALMGACQAGHEDIVDKLLRKKASVNGVSKKGFSPLLLACYSGKTSIVKKLLAYPSIDIHLKTLTSGESPIMIAASRGDVELVKLLIDKGADIESKNKNQWTPLMAAVDGGVFLCLSYISFIASILNYTLYIIYYVFNLFYDYI